MRNGLISHLDCPTFRALLEGKRDGKPVTMGNNVFASSDSVVTKNV
ncbi:hypothetical protein [Niallia sp. NCCP-28]|nr:hypothetical protein [Niallia sp. NCCP-28]